MHFNLHNIRTPWNPYEVLNMYYNGTNDITLDYIKQCFYWNATLQCIQTVNYINNDREIQSITEEHPTLETKLDVYHNAYLSYNVPKKSHGLKLLVIESLKGDPIDNILNYIETNGMVSIRTVFRDIYTDIGINSIIRQLNDKCIDITYNNKDLVRITTLEIGELLRCSLKGSRNSITTCYMIFDGKLPSTYINICNISSSNVIIILLLHWKIIIHGC